MIIEDGWIDGYWYLFTFYFRYILRNKVTFLLMYNVHDNEAGPSEKKQKEDIDEDSDELSIDSNRIVYLNASDEILTTSGDSNEAFDNPRDERDIDTVPSDTTADADSKDCTVQVLILLKLMELLITLHQRE